VYPFSEVRHVRSLRCSRSIGTKKLEGDAYCQGFKGAWETSQESSRCARGRTSQPVVEHQPEVDHQQVVEVQRADEHQQVAVEQPVKSKRGRKPGSKKVGQNLPENLEFIRKQYQGNLRSMTKSLQKM
jgi:hypothetical protein